MSWARRLKLLKAACDVADRNVDEIEKSVELQVLIAPEGEIRTALGSLLDKAPGQDAIDPGLRAFVDGSSESLPETFSNSTLIGTPDQVREQVRTYVNEGVDHFLLWFLDAPDRSGMEIFAREVAPGFR